jgi:hypothetical protein
MVRKRAVVFRDPGVWNYLDERGEQLRDIVPQEKLQIYRSIFAEVERTAADEAGRRMGMKRIRLFWAFWRDYTREGCGRSYWGRIKMALRMSRLYARL